MNGDGVVERFYLKSGRLNGDVNSAQNSVQQMVLPCIVGQIALARGSRRRLNTTLLFWDRLLLGNVCLWVRFDLFCFRHDGF